MTSPLGFFVAFEGGEGAGKSTQVKALAAYLAAAGRDVVVTREPGGTRIGTAIRSLLLDPANADLSARAEALLYAADRAQHVATVIEPALRRGAVVITDRFVDSSLAYQGAARSLEMADVEAINEFATSAWRPDLTVLLDIDPVLGLRRSGKTDRLEAEPLTFHLAVRAEFLSLARSAPARYAVIDADQDPELVQVQVAAATTTVMARWERVNQGLPR
jgi:dTMP kinase